MGLCFHLILLSLLLRPTLGLIYDIFPFAGSGSTGVSDGTSGKASSAKFNGPRSIWQDIQSNFYVVESTGGCIRKIDSSTFIVSSFTGVCGGTVSTVNGPATSGTMNTPIGLFTDSMSQHYVAEFGGNRIRLISSNIISTYGGTGTAASSGNSGKATAATVNGVCGIWGNTVGYIVFVEFYGLYARGITNTGIVFAIAGTGAAGSSGDGGQSTSAALNGVERVFGTSLGNVYISDCSNHKVRNIATTGIISTYVGTGSSTFVSDGLPATSTAIGFPAGTYLHPNGDFYVPELTGNRVRVRSASTGLMSTFAGTGTASSNVQDPCGNFGDALSATFSGPEALLVDSAGKVYLTEYTGYKVRVMYSVSPTGQPSNSPTRQPSLQPTSQPSFQPTQPTSQPSGQPTNQPTRQPTSQPTYQPLSQPSRQPTCRPTMQPSRQPTGQPSRRPSVQPSLQPTSQPSSQPTTQPSGQPSRQPSSVPTEQPSTEPTRQPSSRPSIQPSHRPSCQPTMQPTNQPSHRPSMQPSSKPSSQPSSRPSRQPSSQPTVQPTAQPTIQPSIQPSGFPSAKPSRQPSSAPSRQPTRQPTSQPTKQPITFPSSRPSSLPSGQPTLQPSLQPSKKPSVQPTSQPSSQPTRRPTRQPLLQPTGQPSSHPTGQPTRQPSLQPVARPSSQPYSFPSSQPTSQPSFQPSRQPTSQPTAQPSVQPSVHPSRQPSRQPAGRPSTRPSARPSCQPSRQPSVQPTSQPSHQPLSLPSSFPTTIPSSCPSTQPSLRPRGHPSSQPSRQPSRQPVRRPSSQPSTQPTAHPTYSPSACPSRQPTRQPMASPSCQPSLQPRSSPTSQPSLQPSKQPSKQPVDRPSSQPTKQPSARPSHQPTAQPVPSPSSRPSLQPSVHPTSQPFSKPSKQPSSRPTRQPTQQPSNQPSHQPLVIPSTEPSIRPSSRPSSSPASHPSSSPSSFPSSLPSECPSLTPSNHPSTQPVSQPSYQPLSRPTTWPSHPPRSCPTSQPSRQPSTIPTAFPSDHPFAHPTLQPSSRPSSQPFWTPSSQPSKQPIARPSSQPSRRPTQQPTAKPTAYHTHEPTSQSEQVKYYDLISVTDSTGRDVRWDKIRIELSFVLPSVLSVVDGYADVILTGAVGGQSFVVYSDQVTSMNVTSRIRSTQGFLVSPSMGYDYSARSVSSLGDVNGDGFNDLIIGVPYASRCYVMFGNAEVGYVNMSLGFMVHGASGIDLTGWSVSDAGDVNNDTFADILVGAPRASYGSVRSGAAYVLFGSDRVFRDVYLDDLSPEEGFVMHGESNEDCFGVSVAGAGDVNGDGVDDVLVGALKISSFYAGGAYIVFGGAARVQANALTGLRGVSVGNMSTSDGVSLIGDAWSHSGCSVSGVGDINGDGFDDVLIGSAPLRRGSAVSSEVSYIVYGFDAVRLNVTSVKLSSESVQLVGGGVVVSGIADVNQDGMSDLLIVSNITMSAGVGYVMLYDLLRYAPSARPSVAPSAAPSTVSPTVKPFRSAVPSCGPVVSPSVVPTMSPTRPTAVPSVVPSGPSQCPTSRPSHFTEHPSSRPSMSPSSGPTHTSAPVSPTSSPTVYTEPPTTAVPSEMPSEIPSVSPSVCPSVLPSVSPTTVGPSVYPTLVPRVFARPTLQPTLTVTRHMYSNVSVVLDGSSGGSVNRTEYALRGNYVWSAAVDVSLLGRGSVYGDVITVLPNVNCVLVVQHFNVSVDVIDLRAFPQYTSMKDLNITRGSVIISLPRSQIVRLQSIFPEDLRKHSFRFYTAKSSQPKENASDRYVVVGCVVGVVLLLLITSVYRYFVSAEKWLKQKKIADALIARQKPLIIHTHYSWRHSLIGKYHRNGSEDSLLDYESVGSGSVASWKSSKDGDKEAAAKRFYAQLHARGDGDVENDEEEANEGFDDESNEIGSDYGSIAESEYSVPSNFTVDVNDTYV